MSISSEITSIGENLSKDYEAISNMGIDLTNIDKNIENIATCVNQIYDNAPKTDYAEGSNITLSNTLKSKLDFEDGIVGYGDTKQEIDLTENNLTSQSANQLTITVNADKSITINGTASANTTINILNNTSNNTPATERTLEAGTYQLTGCPSGSDSGAKFKLDVVRSGYITLEDIGNGAIETITSSQTYTYIRILIYSGTVCNNLVFRPKLLKIPSPSYPQDIEVVRGKNLANIEVEGKYRSSASGNFSTNANYNGYIAKVIQNTTYIGSFSNMSSDYNDVSNLCYFDEEMNFISGNAYNTADKTFTTPDNCAYVTMAVKTTITDFQLEKGTTATSYLPYNTLEVIRKGINRFNITDYNNINLTAQTGTTVTKSTNKITILTDNKSSSGFYCTNSRWNTYIDNFVGGKTYTLSMDLKSSTNTTIRAGFEASPEQTSLTANTTKRIVTTTSNTSSAIVVYNTSSTANITIEVTNIMITEDSTQTTFEPYISPISKQLSLGDKELYEDCYIVGSPDNWKYVDNWYKLTSSVLSGFAISTTGNNNQFVVTKGNFVGVPAPKSGKIYCTHLKYNSSAWYTDGYCGIVSPGATLWMQMTQAFESVDAFKTFITTNNMEIVYQTEEPVETPITDTTLITQLNNWYNAHSLNGTTIIEINGQLPLIIKVRALKGE